MTKWTRTRPDPGRTYTDEEKRERKQRMLARLYEFVEGGWPSLSGLNTSGCPVLVAFFATGRGF